MRREAALRRAVPPEVLHTQYGKELLQNFLYGICGFTAEWTMASYLDGGRGGEPGQDRQWPCCWLSGGVDSSVAAALLQRRGRSADLYLRGSRSAAEGRGRSGGGGHDPPVRHVDVRGSTPRTASSPGWPASPIRESKRKIIGEEFIRVFEAEAKKIGAVDFLAQGTIYPDVVESGLGGESVVIKSHHNVGGLPDCVDFKDIVEPLRRLFKDEVRQLGIELACRSSWWRQPFPGPWSGSSVSSVRSPMRN